MKDASPLRTDLDGVFGITRPHDSLWTYYALRSFLAGPFFVVPLLVQRFRFRSLRYRFDDEGVAMSWGVLFRREVHLNYERIQDIHLVSNAIERWLGLARIKIQTASGSAKAEMTIEGVREFELLRDFLYLRMRGQERRAVEGGPLEPDSAVVSELRRATAELRAIRRLLADGGREPTDD